MRKNKKLYYNLAGIFLFVVLILLDQLTKKAAVLQLKGQEAVPVIKDIFELYYLENREAVPVIKDIFELYYLENRGAAFGILQGRQSVFLIIAIAAMVILVYIYVKMPVSRRFMLLRVLLVFIAAGAVGNFIDRSVQGYVVDFFYISAINFPIFNVADIYVTCAVILLIVAVLFYYKDDDWSEFKKSLCLGVKKS